MNSRRLICAALLIAARQFPQTIAVPGSEVPADLLGVWASSKTWNRARPSIRIVVTGSQIEWRSRFPGERKEIKFLVTDFQVEENGTVVRFLAPVVYASGPKGPLATPTEVSIRLSVEGLSLRIAEIYVKEVPGGSIANLRRPAEAVTLNKVGKK